MLFVFRTQHGWCSVGRCPSSECDCVIVEISRHTPPVVFVPRCTMHCRPAFLSLPLWCLVWEARHNVSPTGLRHVQRENGFTDILFLPCGRRIRRRCPFCPGLGCTTALPPPLPLHRLPPSPRNFPTKRATRMPLPDDGCELENQTTDVASQSSMPRWV